MKNRYPEIRHGFARSILITLVTIGAVLAMWQGGLLDQLLPDDVLTWVWVGVMAGLFGLAVLFRALPYQLRIDNEVNAFRIAMQHLDAPDRNRRLRFQALFSGHVFEEKNLQKTRTAEIFRLISQQGRLEDDIREDIDLPNLLGFADGEDKLSTESLTWSSRDLLTLGIVGTYVGITLATGGGDAIIDGDSEQIRAFVAFLMDYVGLALLTTLAGLLMGSLVLTKLLEMAQLTFNRILNRLSVALPTSGYLGWVNAGRPRKSTPTPSQEE